jgi:hypothetical protein
MSEASSIGKAAAQKSCFANNRKLIALKRAMRDIGTMEGR